MADEIQFAEGFYFNRAHENAPSFVLGKVSIQRDKFMQWLEQQDVSEKGYISLDIKESKGGKVYAAVDAWKPSGERKQHGGPTLLADDLDEGIPFVSHERGWLV